MHPSRREEAAPIEVASEREDAGELAERILERVRDVIGDVFDLAHRAIQLAGGASDLALDVFHLVLGFLDPAFEPRFDGVVVGARFRLERGSLRTYAMKGRMNFAICLGE